MNYASSFKLQPNSQENMDSRTRNQLETCNRWCCQDTCSSCHNGQLSSSLQWGRSCPRTLGGTTRVEPGRLISPPLPSPWGCYTTAVFVSHTSERQSCKHILKGSSGACQSSTQPEKEREAGLQRFFTPTFPKPPRHLHLDIDSSCILSYPDSKSVCLDSLSHRDIWHRPQAPAEVLQPPGTELSSTSAGKAWKDVKSCSSHFSSLFGGQNLSLTLWKPDSLSGVSYFLCCLIQAALLLFIHSPWTSHSTKGKHLRRPCINQEAAHFQSTDWPCPLWAFAYHDCAKLLLQRNGRATLTFGH